MRRTLALAGVAFALAAAVAAQGVPPPPPPPSQGSPRDVSPPQTGTSSIFGTIIANDQAALPIRQVIFILNGGGLAIPRQTTSDDRGHFQFTGLPPGSYTLQAWRNNYVRDFYGAKRVGATSGSAIIIAAGERAVITMKLTHSAVITGTLVGANVASNSAVRVQAMQFQTVNGERRLVGATTGGVSPTGFAMSSTDDRGVYRIYGLAPGEYVVSATPFSSAETRPVQASEVAWAQAQIAGGAAASLPPPSAQAVGFAPVFYPGVVDPSQASVISLAAGEEKAGIDFALPRVPVARIEGVFLGPDGQPFPNAQGILTPSSAFGSAAVGNQLRAGVEGRFVVAGIVPGHYSIQVRAAATTGAPSGRGGVPSAQLWAAQEIDVDGHDISGLTVSLQTGMTVSGRLVFDGQGQPPDPARFRVTAISTTPPASAFTAMGTADGTFAVSGIPPGTYRLAAFLGAATVTPNMVTWTPRSAMSRGADAFDRMLEVKPAQSVTDLVVTFSDRASELSGTLFDAQNRPSSDLFIVAFSTDRTMWTAGSRRVAQSRPSSNGVFKFTSLPPGEYFLAATTDIDSSQLTDSSFLESLVRASTKVTLADGEKRVQDLKIAGG